MGRMKDLHIETRNLAQDWEGLVERILNQTAIGSAASLRPDEQPSSAEEYEELRLIPDLDFRPVTSAYHAAVEVRMFRWHNEWHQRISDSIAHMRDILRSGRFDRGIIVATLDLPDNLVAQLLSLGEKNIEVWGIDKLRELSDGNDALSGDLEELLSETILDEDLRSPLRTSPELRQGRLLANKLRQTKPGTGGWRDFELLSEEAIRMLFGRDLSNITAQQRTDDGLNRMDLIDRIRHEGSSFWSMVAADFSTRYVVFDAKNSRDPITQQEIQITEKYLFARGLGRLGLSSRETALIKAR